MKNSIVVLRLLLLSLCATPVLVNAKSWQLRYNTVMGYAEYRPNNSTFCQSLLPTELQWGYTQTAKPSEEKSMLLMMSQMLLVNFDEFNKISPQVQQGFLKNMLSLPVVKAKRPYGRHVEVMPRLSSFIATTNLTDEPGAQWMSASALFQAVRAKVGGSLQVSSLLKFGRALANMPGLQRRVTNQNTQYLVVKL